MCDDGMSKKERSFEPIRLLEVELQDKQGKWLESLGWKFRCDFVDSCWRWCKVIEGVLMMCDLREAINIELEYLD
jgi:hypothetical protein